MLLYDLPLIAGYNQHRSTDLLSCSNILLSARVQAKIWPRGVEKEMLGRHWQVHADNVMRLEQIFMLWEYITADTWAHFCNHLIPEVLIANHDWYSLKFEFKFKFRLVLFVAYKRPTFMPFQNLSNLVELLLQMFKLSLNHSELLLPMSLSTWDSRQH